MYSCQISKFKKELYVILYLYVLSPQQINMYVCQNTVLTNSSDSVTEYMLIIKWNTTLLTSYAILQTFHVSPNYSSSVMVERDCVCVWDPGECEGDGGGRGGRCIRWKGWHGGWLLLYGLSDFCQIHIPHPFTLSLPLCPIIVIYFLGC